MVNQNGKYSCLLYTSPYMINKAEMIKKIADMINDKKIEGISYIDVYKRQV